MMFIRSTIGLLFALFLAFSFASLVVAEDAVPTEMVALFDDKFDADPDAVERALRQAGGPVAQISCHDPGLWQPGLWM